MPSVGLRLRFLMTVYSAAFDRDGLHLHMCSGLTRKLLGLHHLRGYGESLGTNSLGTASLWRMNRPFFAGIAQCQGLLSCKYLGFKEVRSHARR